MDKPFVHRYIPNTTPGVREAILKEIGVDSVDQIYEEIPEPLRFKGKLNIPEVAGARSSRWPSGLRRCWRRTGRPTSS